MTALRYLSAVVCLAALAITTASARDAIPPAPAPGALPIVVARQPGPARTRLDANVKQLLRVMDMAGAPFTAEERAALQRLSTLPDDLSIGETQEILDRHALAYVNLNDEAWFTAMPATFDPAQRVLVQNRWSTFLIKVHNESRVTNPLQIRSVQAIGPIEQQRPSPEVAEGSCPPATHGWAQWFDLRMIGAPLMPAVLSGTEVEYYVVQVCSLDAGDRAADLTFFLGGGPVSQGHYGSLGLMFKAAKSIRDQQAMPAPSKP